jgi:hypothetical protein
MLLIKQHNFKIKNANYTKENKNLYKKLTRAILSLRGTNEIGA